MKNISVTDWIESRSADPKFKETGMTKMHLAAIHGSIDIMEALKNQGDDVDARDSGGCPPIFMAAAYGRIETLEWLSRHGIPVDVENNFKQTPIFFAAANEQIEAMEWLKSHGADILAEDKDGCTPLHFAAQLGQIDSMEWLESQGASINAKNYNGNTPMIEAARFNQLESLEWLKKQGADVNAEDIHGYTALFFAEASGHHDVAVWLRANGAKEPMGMEVQGLVENFKNVHRWNPSGPVQDFFKQADQEEQIGVDENSTDDDDYNITKMHIAASANRVDVLVWLKDTGEEIDAKSGNGSTPLHYAAANGCLEAIRYLYEQGADIHARNTDNWTAMHFAAIGGYIEVMAWLKAHGADVNAKTIDDECTPGGFTPILMAMWGGRDEAAAWLRANDNDAISSHQASQKKPLDIKEKTTNQIAPQAKNISPQKHFSDQSLNDLFQHYKKRYDERKNEPSFTNHLNKLNHWQKTMIEITIKEHDCDVAPDVIARKFQTVQRKREHTAKYIGLISAAENFTVAVDANNRIRMTGCSNALSQCDIANWQDNSDVVAIAVGGSVMDGYHLVGLKSDGSVIAVGNNITGQCDVKGWRNIIAIATGKYHTAGLRKDGTVVVSGGIFDSSWCNVDKWRDIIAITASDNYTIGLKGDGSVVADYNVPAIYTFQFIHKFKDIVAVAGASHHIVGLKKNGLITVDYDLNIPTAQKDSAQREFEKWAGIVAVSANDTLTVGLTDHGEVVAYDLLHTTSWGGIDTIYGEGVGSLKSSLSSWKDIIAIAAGKNHVAGLQKNGNVVAATWHGDWGIT